MREAVLVRVAPELLEQIAGDDSEPVVIVGFDLQPDGAYDMVLRTVLPTMAEARAAERAYIVEALRGFATNAGDDMAACVEALPVEGNDDA